MLARIIKTFNILQFCCIACTFELYAMKYGYDWRFFTLSAFASLSIICMIYYIATDQFDKLKLNSKVTAIASTILLLVLLIVFIYDKSLSIEHYIIAIYCILDCSIWFTQKYRKKHP